MKIIRKSRAVKSKYVGMANDLGIYIVDYSARVFSDEIPLPDYFFLTNRSSYFLEKKTLSSLVVSAMWNRLAVERLRIIFKK